MRVQVVLTVLLSLAAVIGVPGSGAGELKAGDRAPAFTLVGSDGKTYRLADYTGKQAVVLAWFAKAFTGG
jgi:peroxiredoxin Q/BCP